MAYVRNTNTHRVGINDQNYIPAGQAREVSDEDAKAYGKLDGCESLSDQEGQDAVQAQNATVSSEEGAFEGVTQGLGSARTDARRDAIVGPLHRVVGDDLAPLGPPTGTITTKETEARKGPEERRAFADHEAVERVEEPEPKLTPHAAEKEPIIENRQVEAKEQAEASAKKVSGSGQRKKPGPKPKQ